MRHRHFILYIILLFSVLATVNLYKKDLKDAKKESMCLDLVTKCAEQSDDYQVFYRCVISEMVPVR